MKQNLCGLILVAVGVATIIAGMLLLIHVLQEQKCHEAADIVIAVRVCQQREVMCWSTPRDLADMRRALRALEECKK